MLNRPQHRPDPEPHFACNRLPAKPLRTEEGYSRAIHDHGWTAKALAFGPGVYVDLSLARRVRLTESKNVELQADFFNVLNHVNLANPISDLDAVTSSGGSLDASGRILKPGNFGQIISASNNPRIVQLALRFRF